MSAGHGEIRIVGERCVTARCARPARELGGYCTTCWMALTAAQRAHVVWLDEVDREVDREVARQAAERQVRELEALFALGADAGRGRAA